MSGRDSVLPDWARLSLRILLVVGGGYLLAAGASGLAAAALAQVMPRAEATMLMAMLAFLIYLALMLWGFAERSWARLWAAFGVGSLLAFAFAKLIAWSGGV